MKIIFLLFFVIYNLASIACSCGYNGPFLKMAKKSDLVALVKVKGYSNLSERTKTPLAMEVEIIEVFQGIENRKTIIVWGDDGQSCRPYVSQFPKDSVYVMALGVSSEKWGQDNESKKNYYISACGAFWISADLNKMEAYARLA